MFFSSIEKIPFLLKQNQIMIFINVVSISILCISFSSVPIFSRNLRFISSLLVIVCN